MDLLESTSGTLPSPDLTLDRTSENANDTSADLPPSDSTAGVPIETRQNDYEFKPDGFVEGVGQIHVVDRETSEPLGFLGSWPSIFTTDIENAVTVKIPPVCNSVKPFALPIYFESASGSGPTLDHLGLSYSVGQKMFVPLPCSAVPHPGMMNRSMGRLSISSGPNSLASALVWTAMPVQSGPVELNLTWTGLNGKTRPVCLGRRLGSEKQSRTIITGMDENDMTSARDFRPARLLLRPVRKKPMTLSALPSAILLVGLCFFSTRSIWTVYALLGAFCGPALYGLWTHR